MNEEYKYNEESNRHEWNVEPEPDDNDKDLDIPFEDAITRLMAPYEPVEEMKDSDVSFSTNEIITALELHYGVPQGDNNFITKDAGLRVIGKMTMLGFKYVNTGGLNLQWIMRKK